MMIELSRGKFLQDLPTFAEAKQSWPIRPLAKYKRKDRLQSKGIDHNCECGGLLTPARIIEEETGERLTPILQHAY